MQIFSRTDRGLVRETNQDNYCSGFSEDNSVTWAVVCDGMGGQNGGNIASEMAVRSVEKKMKAAYKDLKDSDKREEILVKIIKDVNKEIFKKSCSKLSLSGMGTTIELVCICDNKISVAHVGDSRIYMIQDDQIKQLTKDHSLVQEMVDLGQLTPEQAKVHPYKNLITRAMGISKHIKVDYLELDAPENYTLVLVSDGLTNHVSDDEILFTIKDNPVEYVPDMLIEIANERGGSDNITVVLVLA